MATGYMSLKPNIARRRRRIWTLGGMNRREEDELYKPCLLVITTRRAAS